MLSGIGSSTTPRASPSLFMTNQVPLEKAAFMAFSSSIKVWRSNGWFPLISSGTVEACAVPVKDLNKVRKSPKHLFQVVNWPIKLSHVHARPRSLSIPAFTVSRVRQLASWLRIRTSWWNFRNFQHDRFWHAGRCPRHSMLCGMRQEGARGGTTSKRSTGTCYRTNRRYFGKR